MKNFAYLPTLKITRLKSFVLLAMAFVILGTALAACSSKETPTPDAYRTAGGFDPRFVGWGGEDLAFAAALRTIVGEPTRLEASVWHLHHRLASKIGRMSNTNDRLCRRYLHAEGDTVAMSRLIEEAHQWQTQQ